MESNGRMGRHPLACRCGALRGHVDLPGMSNRAICHCRSCQAFARYLGRPEEILDEAGGTEVVQVAASRVHFDQGAAHLAVVKLGEGGMLRWFAGCCRTPIGNTTANPRLGFVGLVHSCLASQPLQPSFGLVAARVNTEAATGDSKLAGYGLPRSLVRILAIAAGAWLRRGHRQSPFFTPAGAPVVEPVVLEADEVKRLRRPDGGLHL